MTKYLLLALGLLAASPTLAQTASPVPTSYELKSPTDFDTYQPQVIQTVNWLANPATPFGTQQRADAAQFLIEWISGSPKVSVTIDSYVTQLTGQDPDLLTAFLGGWARYSLQNPTEKNLVVLNTEAVKTVLTVYKNKSGKGNKKADELSKLNEQGKISD